jgi:hypothetical protein
MPFLSGHLRRNSRLELRVRTEGCRIQVFYDAQSVFDLCDRTFTAGRVGLWTKSDAVTYFDNLELKLIK